MNRDRRSLSDLARDLEDLGTSGRTVRDWVYQRLQSGGTVEYGANATEPEYTVYNAEGDVAREPDYDGEVKIWEAREPYGMSLWVREETVPEWVPRENLPVRE